MKDFERIWKLWIGWRLKWKGGNGRIEACAAWCNMMQCCQKLSFISHIVRYTKSLLVLIFLKALILSNWPIILYSLCLKRLKVSIDSVYRTMFDNVAKRKLKSWTLCNLINIFNWELYFKKSLNLSFDSFYRNFIFKITKPLIR